MILSIGNFYKLFNKKYLLTQKNGRINWTRTLRFKPLYMERVWGGTGLNTHLGRELPSGNPIGESWEVVDRPEAQSVVEGGFLDGWSLNQALMEHGTFLMGPGWKEQAISCFGQMVGLSAKTKFTSAPSRISSL